MVADDLEILKENFDIETINQMDKENVKDILNYLINEGIYYAKDILLSSFDLFLMDKKNFIIKFEILKKKLGPDFVEKLGEDSSLIEIMYLDN